MDALLRGLNGSRKIAASKFKSRKGHPRAGRMRGDSGRGCVLRQGGLVGTKILFIFSKDRRIITMSQKHSTLGDIVMRGIEPGGRPLDGVAGGKCFQHLSVE